jgi:hypothetical protein
VVSDADPEEEARVRRAIGTARTVLIDALARAGAAMAPGARDARLMRGLKRADREWLDADQLDDLQRLAWRYRRQLPRHLVPRANPDDPVVREMEGSDG